MENCIKKHIQSMAMETDLKSYPDHLTGFTVPYLLENLDSQQEEIVKEIEDLEKSGKLIVKSPYLTMVCPSCGSSDPFTRMVCPKCGSQNLKVEGNEVKCMSCGLHTSVQEALTFVCKTCGKVFGLANAKWMTLGSFKSKNTLNIEPIYKSIRELGIYPSRCKQITGESGMNHRFDFAFESKGNLSVIDIRVDNDGVSVQEVIEFLSKAYDVKVKEAYFIAVPKLKVALDVGKKNVKLFDAPDVEKASELLKQILVDSGISSKIVH